MEGPAGETMKGSGDGWSKELQGSRTHKGNFSTYWKLLLKLLHSLHKSCYRQSLPWMRDGLRSSLFLSSPRHNSFKIVDVTLVKYLALILQQKKNSNKEPSLHRTPAAESIKQHLLPTPSHRPTGSTKITADLLDLEISFWKLTVSLRYFRAMHSEGFG